MRTMDIEKGLVSKVLESKDIRTVIKHKVTPKFFYGETKQVFKFILDYYGEYAETPTLDVVKRYFPNFEIEKRPEPMLYYLDELRNRQKYNMMVKGINDVTKLLEGGKVDEGLTLWQNLGVGITIDTKVTRDLDLSKDHQERIERYERLKSHLGMLGIPYPWEALNEATGGMLDEELISVIGFQAVGKSWILLSMLHHAWVNGKKVVLFTREMSPEQMERRIDAIHFGLPYQDFKKGRLGQQLEEMYKSKIKDLENMPQFIISADEEEGSGVSAIRAKLEEYQPDIFGVDGAYLLADDRDGKSNWERIMHITQDLKKVCRTMQIPAIITSQAGVDSQTKQGVSLTSVAFSKLAFGADSDIVIGIDDLVEEEKWRLKLLKQREGEKFSFLVNKDFKRMKFEQVGTTDNVDAGSEREMEEHDVIMY